MGWAAYYQVLRDRSLDRVEVGKLVDHIDRMNDSLWDSEPFQLLIAPRARPDGVIAQGCKKLPFDQDASDDHQRLCNALNGLHKVIEGVELRISDDFDVFGFEDGKVSLTGDRGPDLVDVASAELVAPESIVPRSKEGIAVAFSTPPKAAEVGKALVALGKLARQNELDPRIPELMAQFAALDPLIVATAGLTKRRQIGGLTGWRPVSEALDRLEDIAPVVEPFLKMWNQSGGIYWHHDLSVSESVCKRLMADPRVETRMCDDLAQSVSHGLSEADHRRAEKAAYVLSRASSTKSRAALIRNARHLRGIKLSSDQLYHSYRGTLGALAYCDVAATVPSLLLAFATAMPPWNACGMLGRIAPSKCLPVLRAAAGSGFRIGDAIDGLLYARDVETLRQVASTQDPYSRERVVAALEKLGHAAPPVESPQALVVHPIASIREESLFKLECEMNPRWMVSILAAKSLAFAIASHYGGSVRPSGRYIDLLPLELRQARPADQLAAVRAGKAPNLGQQEIWPSVASLLEGDFTAVATSYPNPFRPTEDLPTLEFDAACAAALAAEEAAMLEALDAGLEPPLLDPTPVILAR